LHQVGTSRHIDTTLTWKHHIGELTSRLNKACYAIRSIKPFMSLDILRSTYFSYAHSIISYGIIFWGNSFYSEDIFKIQKIIIRIMNSSRNASCRQLFKYINILPIQSQYIYSLLLLLKIKTNLCLTQVHQINTRKTSHLYVPTAILNIYQNGVYYSGINIYSHLPTAIKDFFYSLEEYFNT